LLYERCPCAKRQLSVYATTAEATVRELIAPERQRQPSQNPAVYASFGLFPLPHTITQHGVKSVYLKEERERKNTARRQSGSAE